jgi:hypothetical protein
MDLASYIAGAHPTLPHAEVDRLLSWLKGYDPAAPASSNLPSIELPFQRWYKFKEAFSPVLVLECISRLGFKPASCLDCFGGSGTTPLTCQFLGIHPVAIEVNPFLADLIEAKLQIYDLATLLEDYAQVIEVSNRTRFDLRTIRSAQWPQTLVEPGMNGRWIFPREVFRQILSLRYAIEQVRSERNSRLLRVLLGSILLDLSNVYVNGKGRRYRLSWKDRQKQANEVLPAFTAAFNQAYADVSTYTGRQTGNFTLHRGDARTEVKSIQEVDLVLFSPPYPNSFDYTDIYNIELWTLGYLAERRDNRLLREATLRSHVQIERDLSWDNVRSSHLAKTVKALRERADLLWSPAIPDMVGAYFADMSALLCGLRKKINPKGAVMMTVGNSRYAEVVIEVGKIIKEIAPAAGFVCESIESIRAMRTSAQQGGRLELSEDLVVLRPI